VHAGTGSFLAARSSDGTLHYAGGLGWRFGDPGSGHDLGRRGIARALLELQGWADPSPLATALREYTGLADYIANSRSFYLAADADARIAAFAPRVVELAAHGCDTARQIVAESVAGLAELVDAVLQRAFPRTTVSTPLRCGVSGTLLNQPPCLQALRAVAASHGWPVQLQPIVESPIEGVRRLLMRSD
jgi:N-acetylglucosamine kinase-like BadF-type ATPase